VAALENVGWTTSRKNGQVQTGLFVLDFPPLSRQSDSLAAVVMPYYCRCLKNANSQVLRLTQDLEWPHLMTSSWST